MDRETAQFCYALQGDPWAVLDFDLPLPADLDTLRHARDILYAIIHSVRCTLDDALPMIGRLIEIDRRIAALKEANTPPP